MPPKRMTANPIRPARYRPGKPVAPEPYESSDEEDEDEDEEASEDEKPSKPSKEPAAIVSSALKKVDLNKRFEQARREEEARKAAEESSEDEDDKGTNSKKEHDTSDEEEEDSSEYTSGSDEDEESEEEVVPKPVLLRPKFIPKSKRNGNAVLPVTAESVAAAALDEEQSKKKAEEAERRKGEAQALVEEHLRQQAEAKEAARKAAEDDHANDASLIDDTDDLDPAAERTAWKLRELMRVKRERDELEKVEKEREEIERRRNMDEKERFNEDMEYVRKQREEAKEARGEMKFMQKYYHKGAFYQDDSEIFKRNYATAAVEDQAVNKEILPKYMQVRGEEYGKRGKTKWTHLAAEDTSKVEGGSPWFDKKFSGSSAGKLGGMKDERFLSDKPKEGKKDTDDRRNGHDRWDGSERGPPDGPKVISNQNRSRIDGRQDYDRTRRRRSRSRSWSRDRNRGGAQNRGGDIYYPRHRDKERDRRGDEGRDARRYDDRYGHRHRDRSRDRNPDREGDRKRRPTDRDEGTDKRRRVDAP